MSSLSELLYHINPQYADKSLYLGKITQTYDVEFIMDDGEVIQREIVVEISWETIKKLMELILNSFNEKYNL